MMNSSSDMNLPSPLPGPSHSFNGVEMSVRDVSQQPSTSEIPPPPAYRPLPPTPSKQNNPSSIGKGAHAAARESPRGSVGSALGTELKDRLSIDDEKISFGEQLIGISFKNLKKNFRTAMKKDKGPHRYLKRAARVTGLVTGITLNVLARVVAIPTGIAGSLVVMVGYTAGALFCGGRSTLWKNPQEALMLMFAGGATIGAFSGAVIGFSGNLLIKASLDMEIGSFEKEATKALEDNVVAGAIGAGIGTMAALANPLTWRAAWVPDKDI